jgi:hypothetical protein
MSDYPTLSVMKSDVSSLAPPPPQAPSGESPAAPLAGIRECSVDEIAQRLDQFVRAQKGFLALDNAADGSAGIPSLIAAWLLTEVGKATGAPRPVDLSHVTDRNDLRSVAGVARLLHKSFHPAHGVAS